MPTRGLSSTGRLNVLIVPAYPTDRSGNVENGTGTIEDAWGMVKTYYRQVSYGKLDISVKCAGWSPLSGDSKAYVTNEKKNGNWVGVAPNVKYEDDHATMNRLWSEAAEAAKNQGIKLDLYDILVCVINLDGNNGNPIRGYGDYSCKSFKCEDADLNINIPLDKPMRLIVVDERASWGRCAHEVGHCLLSDPVPVGSGFCEDLYPEDGVDATAAGFDLMGHHEEAPLFSAYCMERGLKYYAGDQVKEIDWRDRDTFSQAFEIAAHGLEPNKSRGRYNVLKIWISDSLCYYVEVRQRSMGGKRTGQVFDRSINLGARQPGLSDEANVGGVVVTQVMTGPTVSTNQAMRFITLRHNQQRLTTEEFARIKRQNTVDPRLPHVLKAGKGNEGIASDPLRGMTITAVEPVSDRPLAYKVRVEWDKTRPGLAGGTTYGGAVPNPKGTPDLWIRREGTAGETQDIWVESPPFDDGKWDYGYDDVEKRPRYGGDRPIPGVENRIYTRVRRRGGENADDVGVHFYSISPPGIGGNGNWSPINYISGPVGKDAYMDFGPIAWTPVDDRATSLTVCIDPGKDERIYSDNWAQEITFDTDSHYRAESDTPSDVPVSLDLHNPLGEPAKVYVKAEAPPDFDVALPAPVMLGPHENRTVCVKITPTKQYRTYVKSYRTNVFKIRLAGYAVDSRRREHRIGGIATWVSFKQRADIRIWKNTELSGEDTIAVEGRVEPAATGKIYVILSGPQCGKNGTGPRCLNIGKDGTFGTSFTGVVPGRYTVQARIVNSRDVAQGKSNAIDVILK